MLTPNAKEVAAAGRDLEYEDWVESRRRYVEQATNGRIGYVHIRQMEAADLERESIYDLLERLHGIVVSRAQESLRPVVLDRRSAGLLSVADESAAFAVDRVSWSPQRPIEWQQSLIRGDRYLYSVDLPRSKKN